MQQVLIANFIYATKMTPDIRYKIYLEKPEECFFNRFAIWNETKISSCEAEF